MHRRSRLVACTCRVLAVRLFLRVALLVLPVMSGLGTAPAFAQGDAPQGIAESAVPDAAAKAHGGAPHLDGAELGLLWVAPLVGILLSIALFPLVLPPLDRTSVV